MKKSLLLLCVCFLSLASYAAGLNGARIYVNPGHGSFGANDRPMPTIPYPNLSTTGMPDTCGFYESNTNLWKAQELVRKLRAAGATVDESHTMCGPWDYVYPYSDYTWAKYQARKDFRKYNRVLSEVAEEVESGNYDYFVSIHSNSTDADAQLSNYLYLAIRGDGNVSASSTVVVESKKRAQAAWPYVFAAMGSGLEVHGQNYTATNPNVKQQSLSALTHSVPGWLSEGYFHSYQPSRHRALNKDYCREEGLRYYRGLAAWFNQAPETKGYILGTVKDMHERMNHELFTYRPNTHDQYLPCNGAVVTLYKAGVKVADYTVDNNYNGLFFFRDLEPGDYTLDISCAGYKALLDEYKAVTVKANETTYPITFLESTDYVAVAKPVDYPNPVQPTGTTLPTSFNTNLQKDTSFAIEGTIKRTIGVGDSTIVLSHTSDKVAHLYLIDHLTGVIKPISTSGIRALDTSNKGEGYPLSDIAYTCDGKLIGINSVVCQYNDSYVETGYKRGKIYLYKWDSFNASAQQWVTLSGATALSGNFYRATSGHSMTVSGESSDCMITFTATNTASSAGMRFVRAAIIADKMASLGFNKPAATADCSPLTQGNNYLLQLSPRDTQTNFILDGEKSGAVEIGATGETHTRVGNMSSSLLGAFPSETNFFKYANRSILVSPYVNASNKVAGVRLYDITDGLDKAVLVQTSNTDLATPVSATFAAATAKVTGKDITIYLTLDKRVITFTSIVEEPITHLHMRTDHIALFPHDKYYLNIDVTPADADKRQLYWSSDNDEVATVTDDGFVTAHAVGKATITVSTLDNSVSASCVLTVVDKEAASQVIIETTEHAALFTWASVAEAYKYEFAIYADAAHTNLVCNVACNAWGQLMSITFPNKKPAAEQPIVGNLLQFTIDGLQEGTEYAFTLNGYDADDNAVLNRTGSFITKGTLQTTLEHTQTPTDVARKVLENGVIYIIRGNEKYTIDGLRVK